MTAMRQAPGDGSPHPLWFSPPDSAGSPRRALTRERVVTEALALISADGAESLSMRGLAARLGVVPGALYRHVRSKEQLQDLILDGVLAEIDCQADQSQTWNEQVTILAGRLRTVLEDHPGIAGLLKTRDLISPHSLALAEAFLKPLHAAGLPAARASTTTRSASRSETAPPSASSASRTPTPVASSGPSSGRCPQTASPSLPPSASMYGPAIATRGLPPA
jgi:AcrR family transcriptional regulator